MVERVKVSGSSLSETIVALLIISITLALSLQIFDQLGNDSHKIIFRGKSMVDSTFSELESQTPLILMDKKWEQSGLKCEMTSRSYEDVDSMVLVKIIVRNDKNAIVLVDQKYFHNGQ